MQLNAIWALSRERNGHRHQLLVQDIDGTVFERLFVKRPKAFIGSGAFSSSFFSRVRFLISNM
jgi:hypothetical protein